VKIPAVSRRALIALLGLAVLAPADGVASAYDVVIRRTEHGIPHILARGWGDMGFGYGYAFAEDNICTIAPSYVTVDAERSRFFGPDKSWRFEGNGSIVNNLNSDFFFQRIKSSRTVENLLAQPPPNGPVPQIRKGVRGYVAGYNAYLRDTGVDNLPDPTCKGKPWVRPIDEMDVYRYFYKLASLASAGVAIDGIGSAQPPFGGTASTSAADREELVPELANRFALESAGSNAYGLGKQATRSGHGMVLGNPHFPWQGSQRFYQSHLTIPGELDVTGASLFGVPLVLIGHTRTLAWSHTVSTARRFTPYEEKLVPGDPTAYMYDGQVRRMKAEKVTVDGFGTRTLYSTHHGPMFTSLLGLPLFPWTPAVASSLGDANAANFRYVNHFFEVNRAGSVRELDAILRRYQGIPWVNTIAADSTGEAYYADIGTVPHVTNEKAAACNTALGAQTFDLLGVAILDGSRSECEWGSDPDAAAPGILGPGHLPSLFRDDYVTNSNDSYWLSNPEQPLEGFPRIVGDERRPRALRTRIGLKMVAERIAAGGFSLLDVQDTVFNNRQYAAELFRDSLVEMCKANPMLTGTSGPVDVSEACPILERWDMRDDLDSRGAILFRRFASRALNLPGAASALGAAGIGSPDVYTTPFDPNDAVNTPRGLNTASSSVRAALADAVKELRDLSIPLDARLRDWQYELRGDDRIPIHGGPGSLGVFNAIGAPFAGAKGFPDITTGSSFVMAAHLTGGCPESRAILTYSLSANPRSPYYADQTRLFSQKRWLDMLFCEQRLLRERLRVTEFGCITPGGFTRARVSGRPGDLRVRFRRGVAGLPVKIELLSVSGGGGMRRIARLSRTRPAAIRLPLRPGVYVARLTTKARTGRTDVRELPFRVRGGGILRLRPFARPERCGLLRSARLSGPVLGKGASLRLRLARRARVRVTVLTIGGRVVLSRSLRGRAGVQKLRLGRSGLSAGAYRVRVVARAGKRRGRATLHATRP
jgi:acyl-homoserine-lactone acylase